MPELDYFLRYRIYALQRAEFYYVGKIPRTGRPIEHGYSPPVAVTTHGFEASKDRCRR